MNNEFMAERGVPYGHGKEPPTDHAGIVMTDGGRDGAQLPSG